MEQITVIISSDAHSNETLFVEILNRVDEFDVLIEHDENGIYKVYSITMPNDALCGIKLSVAVTAANMLWHYYQ